MYGKKSLYCADISFNYKKLFDLDAYKIGNVARFFNHSCRPNVAASKIIQKGRKTILVIHAISDILPDEELTW